MTVPQAPQRVQRPLAFVAALLIVAGLFGAVTRLGNRDQPASVSRPAGETDTSVLAERDRSGPPGTADRPAAGDASPVSSSSSVVPVPPAFAAVPAAGTYRYTVERTRDGETETFEEVRIIELVESTPTSSAVRLEVRTDGQAQISMLDWAPRIVTVRSTRVPSASDEGSECAWGPPITEFGELVDGASWTVSSTCTADVAGVPSTFEVDGSGRVIGDVIVRVGERDVRVWRIERIRTTVITADVAGERVVQRVEERGDLYLDPERGIVVQSDVVLTRSGPQSGTTRRRASLVD